MKVTALCEICHWGILSKRTILSKFALTLHHGRLEVQCRLNFQQIKGPYIFFLSGEFHVNLYLVIVLEKMKSQTLHNASNIKDSYPLFILNPLVPHREIEAGRWMLTETMSKLDYCMGSS